MSPTEVIERAAEGGVLVALSPSGRISAKGVQSAIDRWLPAIRQNKDAIIRLLRPGGDGWSAGEWQAFFDERAGITEFDGGLSRARAEGRALEWCLAEWLIRNPAYSSPNGCSAVVAASIPTIVCCLLGSEARVKFGCILVANPSGMPGGGLRLS